MKLDLSEISDIEINFKLIPAFQELGWKHTDAKYIERYLNLNKNSLTWISIYPHLLSYEDKIHVWYCCRVGSRWDVEKMSEYLRKELFPQLKFKPFHDEDAYDGYFNLQKNQLCFYINPSFPEGYWYNHTL